MWVQNLYFAARVKRTFKRAPEIGNQIRRTTHQQKFINEYNYLSRKDMRNGDDSILSHLILSLSLLNSESYSSHRVGGRMRESGSENVP
jgi:hypothetical protein